jgi:outer membrane protein
MRKFLLYKLLLGYLFFVAQISVAEDLMEIYQKAVLYNPQVLGAKNVNKAAVEVVTQATGQLLPQVSFQYARSKTKQIVDESENSFFTPVGETIYNSANYSLSVTQPLFNWASYKNYRKSQSELSQADAEFFGIQQDLILRTTERYIEALAANDGIGLVLSEKTALQRQLEQVRLMTRSGTVPKSELYDVQARYASVEADEISARSAYNNSLEALREIVGDISGQLSVLKPGITLVAPEPQEPDFWMKRAIENNPRVIVRSRAVDASQHQIGVDTAGHLPVLSISASINESDDIGNSLGSDLGSDEETRQVQLTLDIPLYQGGTVSARARSSYQLYEKASQDLREIKYSIQRSTRESYNGIISAISRVNALDKSVEAQQLALQQRKKGFRSGLYTGLDVLDAERDLHEAKRNYASARYDYLLNWLRLKHSAGIMAEKDVREINQWLQKAAL